MERKNYSKPFMYTERFTPQCFCVACTLPGKYSVYAPYLENGKADGWQDHGMNNMDDWYQNYWRIYFDSYSIKLVTENDYTDDYQGKYWQIILGSKGKLVYNNGTTIQYSDKNPIAAGQIVWKNLGNGVESGVVEPVPGGDKNFS